MDKQDFHKAYQFLRTHNNDIPDNVLDFMLQASLSVFDKSSETEKLIKDLHRVYNDTSAHLRTHRKALKWYKSIARLIQNFDKQNGVDLKVFGKTMADLAKDGGDKAHNALYPHGIPEGESISEQPYES